MGSKQSPTIQLGGVIVGKSPYTLPSGSMHIGAKNMVQRETDKHESRRGLERIVRLSRYDKLIAYGGALFAHQFDADGGDIYRLALDFLTAFNVSGTIVTTNPSTRKVQSAAAGNRLFVTTSSGLKAIDAATGINVLRNAGGPVAPSPVPTPGVTATAGFLGAGKSVAYRYTIGLVTPFGTQVIGPPSGRFFVQNTTGGGLTTSMFLILPPGLSDSHFIQVWRSAQVTTGDEPDDDMRLVYERAVTAGEAVAKFVTIEDVVADDLRGEFLYTNPNSGEGIQQANDQPPLAEEVVLHKDRLWLGRTTQPWEVSFKILAIGGATGMAANDRILISSQSPLLMLTEGTDFAVITSGSASQNIRDTALSLVSGINYSANNTSVWAEYIASADGGLGEIRIYERTPNLAGPFEMFVDQRNGGAAWTRRAAFAPEFLPYLPGRGTAITFSLTRTLGTTVVATISSGNLTNALRVGESVAPFAPSGAFSNAGPFTVTAVSATTFTYLDSGSNTTTAGYVFNSVAESPAQASQDSFINRIHYSKPFEYEAFPRGDYAEVGASDKGIIAMRVTRETLWVFKEDGLFRITGDDASTFDVERVDATVIAITPECVQPFAESVVAWTTKGIVMISESSFDIISEDVDALLRAYLSDDALRALADSYRPDCFFLVDEQEGLLRLHLKGSGFNEAGVAAGAGEALVYSTKTKTWHRWAYLRALDEPCKDLRHGLVNPVDRRVFYVDGYFTAGEGFIWRERTYATASTYLDTDRTNPGGAGATFPIPKTALWVAQFDKAPMLDKRWDEVTLLFGQPTLITGLIRAPGAFSYGFGNETSEQAMVEGITVFGMAVAFVLPAIYVATSATPNSPNVRIQVPINWSRGQRLWIRVDHAANEEFTLHGFATLAEVLNASIGR